MVRLNPKSLNQVFEIARELLQDSVVTEIYELTYQAAVTNYVLPGFTTNDPRVLSIEAIEGINFAGNWVTEDDLTEGVDYSLYSQYDTVDDGYGAVSGQNVYQGITISTLTFKDNSTVYIRYRYQSPDFRPILTNFAGNSQLRTFLSAVFSNLQQDLSLMNGYIDSFGISATGIPLERLVTIVDLKRTSAVATTGKIQITNNSSTESFSITSATRFVARRGAGYITFKSITGSGSVGPNSTATIDVVAIEGGKQGNVGPYSIVEGFVDVGLTTKVPSTVVITNPPTIAGNENFFDNGSDAESDPALKRRFQLAMANAKTSSRATLEKAAFDTNFLYDVVNYDYETRKGVVLYQSVLVIQTPTGNILSPTALTTIKQAAEVVKPSGHQVRIEQTMNTYLTLDVTVFVTAATLEDTSELSSVIENTLDSHIDSKIIGEDIFPSTLLALIISSNEVKDAQLTELTVSEYVSETFDVDTEIELSNNAGAEQNRFALQIHFNSVVAREQTTYNGVDAFYDVTNTPIDERVDPRVNKAVLDYNNEYRASPLNVTDFFSLVTNSSTRVTYDPNTDTVDPIVNGDDILIDYNYYDNLTIDGIRILLNGVDGQQVDIELRVGATPDTATLVHADTQKTITLDGGGVEKIYEAEFTNPQTLDPSTNKYWIFVTYNSGNTDVASLPVDTSNSLVPFNPETHIDGQGETTPGAPDGTYERLYNRAVYQTYKKYTGSTIYNKIIIPSRSFHSESSRMFQTNLTFQEFVEE